MRALIAALILAAAPVAAQQNCAPRAQVVESLTEKYGETVRAMGLDASRAMLEVFASDKSGSWTITKTMPNGITCMFAAGTAFEINTTPPPPEGTEF